MLDPRHPKARHAAAVNGALPPGELLEAEGITLAGLVDGQKPAGNGCDYFRLATNHPAGRAGGRKRVERQGFAERPNDLCGTNFLILEHYKTSTTLNYCRWAIFNRRPLRRTEAQG